jgi:NAD(P)H-dependent FMN reductase
MTTFPKRGPAVAIVIGSTRPGRICPGIAGWVRRHLQAGPGLDVQTIDLAEAGLPFLDEPLKPAADP